MKKLSTKGLDRLKLSPTTILSQEVVNDIFGQVEGMYLGSSSTPSLSSFCDFMEKWVDAVDQRIYEIKRYTPLYFLLFTNRGFTYHEYKLLFKEIPEEKYKHYPVFEFLRIPSKDALIEFRLGIEETKESYFQVLHQTLKNTNRTGIDFFLRGLKTSIPLFELQKHCYICGATGSGKSELLRLMFYRLQKDSEAKKTRSLILIDPHGDLCEQIKNSHLNKDSNRIIYVEPGLRKGWSPVINPLEINSKEDSVIVARAQFLAEAIQEAVKVDLTANMNALLIPSLSLLLRLEDTTLLDLIKLMRDDKELLAKGRILGTRAHKEFFHNFLDPHYKKTKTAIYTKLQSFLNYPAFYNLIIGKSTIDVGKVINSGRILIFNLSLRFFGPDASKAFGRFIISLIKSHVIVRKQYRKPTYLFIDECQNFISPSIQGILEETRKYGLHLIMANQSVERLGNIEDVVLSNTSVKLIGKGDSIKTAKKMSSITGIDSTVFKNLRNYHFLVKTSNKVGQVFKASDVLILDRSLTLKIKDQKTLNHSIIDKYYRKIEEELSQIDEKENNPLFDL